MYDVIVVGAGPAGLTTAIHASFEGLNVLVVHAPHIPCQMCQTSWIENYPGYSQGVSGYHLQHEMITQAARLGVKLQGANIVDLRIFTSVDLAVLKQLTHINSQPIELLDDIGKSYVAKTVVLATGLQFKPLNIPGIHLDGIHYGPLPGYSRYCRDKNIVVIGGANSAGQAVKDLAKYAQRVCVLTKHDALTDTMSKHLAEELDALDNVEICVNCLPVEFCGNGCLQEINTNKGVFKADKTFICIGQEPATAWLPDTIWTDESNHIMIRKNMETFLRNVFAVGDVVSGHAHRIATAVGDGANVVPHILKRLER